MFREKQLVWRFNRGRTDAGVHYAGGSPAPAEIWARADASGMRSSECLARSDSFTAWVKEKTYTYDHARRTVFVDPGITMRLSP